MFKVIKFSNGGYDNFYNYFNFELCVISSTIVNKLHFKLQL